MDTKRQIQSLLNEAGVYHQQGLYEESMEKYALVVSLITERTHISEDNMRLLNAVSLRIESLKEKIHMLEAEPVASHIPTRVFDVIKSHFFSPSDNDQAALEEALAFAEFGKDHSALENFTKLLKNRSAQ